MKIVSFLISLFFLINLNGQNPTVNIICDTGIDCFFTNPIATVFYNASVTANGWTVKNNNYSWSFTPSGSGIGGGGQGTPSHGYSWNNSANTTTKRVKVTVTFSKTGQPDKVVTDEKVVVVKHIAPIASMTVDGATYNTSGSTAAVPCGTSSFAVSVPMPLHSSGGSMLYHSS